jgi:hypothetical protein
MATCPVPVPPVRSSIISVSVRSVIITGRIVGRAVKHWHWKRDRESDENSSLGLRLEKHRHGKNKRKDQKKSSHKAKLSDEPADHWVTECRVFNCLRLPGALKETPLQANAGPPTLRHDSLAPPRAPGQVKFVFTKR